MTWQFDKMKKEAASVSRGVDFYINDMTADEASEILAMVCGAVMKIINLREGVLKNETNNPT